MKLQQELEEVRLKRKEANEQQIRKEKEPENHLPTVSPSNETKQIRYENTNKEPEASQVGPVISLEEAEWERRQKLAESSRLCEQVCQLQLIT